MSALNGWWNLQVNTRDCTNPDHLVVTKDPSSCLAVSGCQLPCPIADAYLRLRIRRADLSHGRQLMRNAQRGSLSLRLIRMGVWWVLSCQILLHSPRHWKRRPLGQSMCNKTRRDLKVDTVYRLLSATYLPERGEGEESVGSSASQLFSDMKRNLERRTPQGLGPDTASRVTLVPNDDAGRRCTVQYTPDWVGIAKIDFSVRSYVMTRFCLS